MPPSSAPRAAAPVERAEILDAPRSRGVVRDLPGRQKAAIIVRLLLAEGVSLPLTHLPDHLQAALTEQIGRMRLVDRGTLDRVVTEFVAELEAVGLSFPGGIDGALTMLDGHISASAANRLRRMPGYSGRGDPWDRLAALPVERLLPVLERESLEIGAVLLSKIDAGRAGELLERLPGDRARRLAHAMARTGRIAPETVSRIGMAIAQQLEAEPVTAFDKVPEARVGAILNSSPAKLRDSVLAGLDEEDPSFAQEVRRNIFTFAHIPARLSARDVPQVVREVPQQILLRALVAAQAGTAEESAGAEFLIANLTQRMAESLRGSMAEHAPVTPREGETAMAEVVSVIRGMEGAGAITLRQPGEPDPAAGTPAAEEAAPAD
jgi:flagellar motor switch protein FliG